MVEEFVPPKYVIEPPHGPKDPMGTSMRWVEVGLNTWLSHFRTPEGLPIRVVFAPVTEAFSSQEQLDPKGAGAVPKGPCGEPIYGGYPASVRYPVIGVSRKGWTFRRTNTWSIYPQRRHAWTTDTSRPVFTDMTQVMRYARPMGWDYKFQIDYYSLRPDSMAWWLELIMQTFWRTGGPEPQTWIKIPYPDWFKTNYVRVKLDGGSIDNMTQDVPDESNVVEYRTSFTITIEAYVIDHDFELAPAAHTLVFKNGDIQFTVDLLETPHANPTLDMPMYRGPFPPETDIYGPIP